MGCCAFLLIFSVRLRTNYGTFRSPGIKVKNIAARRAALCDVAPTVLYLMGLPVPPEMSGQPILQKA